MASLLPNSAGPFTPRKEFQKSLNVPHDFALLAFNGADVLRLSNFPPNVISALRRLFEEQHIFRGFRDDQELGVSEFVMADKVWTSGKHSRAERLVTLIFSVILSHHFKLVTTLAYGRLAQDTCSLVFSRPAQNAPPTSGSSVFTHPNASKVRNTTPPLPSDAPSKHRTTFALSLTSKCLRVVCPPKSCTPGILASVRSAWPRGVVSESRTEDDVYEFNLQGYSLFSASTFERDALAHIFTLLRALDAQSLHLITNLNLTQDIVKSRTKDLWIFDAPADPPSPNPSLSLAQPERRVPLVGSGSGPNTGSTLSGPGMVGIGAGYTQYLMEAEGARHIRAATDPSDTASDTATVGVTSGHARSVSAPLRGPATAAPTTTASKQAGPRVLRKAPPAQLVGIGRSDSQGSDTKKDRLDIGVVMPLVLETVSPFSVRMPEPFPDGSGTTFHQTGQHQSYTVDVLPSYSHSSPSCPQPMNFGDDGFSKAGASGGAATVGGAELRRTHGAVQTTRTEQEQRDRHHISASPTSPASEEDSRLLHGNAFRCSGYSFTTDGRPDTEQNTITGPDDDYDDDDEVMTRMGNTLTRTRDLVASQNVDEQLGIQRPQDIRRKSEKASFGFMMARPEHAPPVPALQATIPEHMATDAATVGGMSSHARNATASS